MYWLVSSLIETPVKVPYCKGFICQPLYLAFSYLKTYFHGIFFVKLESLFLTWKFHPNFWYMMRLNFTVPFSCNNKYSEDASTLLLFGDSISSSLSHAGGTEPILLQLERSIIKPLFFICLHKKVICNHDARTHERIFLDIYTFNSEHQHCFC